MEDQTPYVTAPAAPSRAPCPPLAKGATGAAAEGFFRAAWIHAVTYIDFTTSGVFRDRFGKTPDNYPQFKRVIEATRALVPLSYASASEAAESLTLRVGASS